MVIRLVTNFRLSSDLHPSSCHKTPPSRSASSSSSVCSLFCCHYHPPPPGPGTCPHSSPHPYPPNWPHSIACATGDHDRRWKWHRPLPKLLAGSTKTSRGESHRNPSSILFLIPFIIQTPGWTFPWPNDPDLWLSEGEYGFAKEGD